MEIDALVWVPDFNDGESLTRALVTSFWEGRIPWFLLTPPLMTPWPVWASGKVVGLRQAELSSTIDARIEIFLDGSGQVVALAPEEVLLRNPGRDDAEADDLIRLPHLHEPSILSALVQRAAKGNVYTHTGPILLAVNPYRKLPIYTVDYVNMYKANGLDLSAKRLPPHLYSVADEAFRAMLRGIEGRIINRSAVTVDQSVLVSGESGAGKTMSTRFIMQYLALVGSAEEGATQEAGVQARVLESNPVLESFGNARTVRNDNSSRFGK